MKQTSLGKKKKRLSKRLLAIHDFLPLNAQMVMMCSKQIQKLHLPDRSLKETLFLPPFLSLVERCWVLLKHHMEQLVVPELWTLSIAFNPLSLR